MEEEHFTDVQLEEMSKEELIEYINNLKLQIVDDSNNFRIYRDNMAEKISQYEDIIKLCEETIASLGNNALSEINKLNEISNKPIPKVDRLKVNENQEIATFDFSLLYPTVLNN